MLHTTSSKKYNHTRITRACKKKMHVEKMKATSFVCGSAMPLILRRKNSGTDILDLAYQVFGVNHVLNGGRCQWDKLVDVHESRRAFGGSCHRQACGFVRTWIWVGQRRGFGKLQNAQHLQRL